MDLWVSRERDWRKLGWSAIAANIILGLSWTLETLLAKFFISQMRWKNKRCWTYMPVNKALERLKWEDCEFWANLGYIVKH